MNTPVQAEVPILPRAVTAPEWRRVGLALGVGLLLLGALFNQEVVAAIRTWDASTAYNHCFLVIPIALYLVWDRRFDLVGTGLGHKERALRNFDDVAVDISGDA